MLLSIPLEKLLNTTFSKKYCIFTKHSRHLLILNCNMMSHVEVIIPFISFEWRIQLSFRQFLPRKIFQPRMFFYLIRTSPTKSHHWFSLKKLVYKICCLNRPTLWNIWFFNYCLTSQNLLFNLRPWPAWIRSSSNH